jgi:hypothetical protein
MDRSEWVAWRRSLSEAEYASHIVSTSPRSIEGSGGSDVCFSVAMKLWENFDDRSVVEGAMRQYNAQSCDPAWSEAELQHKITTAAAKLGSAVGSKKWRGNSGGNGSKVAPMRLGMTAPAPPAPPMAAVRATVTPHSPAWAARAESMVSKMGEAAADVGYPDDWLHQVRGIDPAVAIGLGIGYSNRDDYAVPPATFDTEKPATIYRGYTVPIRNATGEIVGVIFIRPTAPKGWRYLPLLGGKNYPFGVDALRYDDPTQRIVLLLEGTINWLAAMQTVAGQRIDGMRVVVLGMVSATTPIDDGIIGLLRPDDIVIGLADDDDAGDAAIKRWGDQIMVSRAAYSRALYPSAEKRVDFNDLLLAERDGSFNTLGWMRGELSQLIEACKEGLDVQ